VRLGRYELGETLGSGGAGIVYRARTPEGQDVALKVLQRAADAGAVARFEREARLLRSFGRDEGFVPLLDVGTVSNADDSRRGGPLAFLVFEFLPGGTLRGRLARGALPVEQAISVTAALARALAHAHERGIVHRDLKPENVLFTADGSPLVADLGLAKHFRDDAPGSSRSVSLSRAGEMRGTAGYMAPEQMHDAKNVGPAADVFALGAILHECVTGRPAFEAATVIDLITLVEAYQVAPLRRLRSDAPPWLESVVARALARDPATRYRSAHELARALAAGQPRRRVGPLVAGGLALAALTASAFFLVGRARAPVHGAPATPAPTPAPPPGPPAAPVPATPPTFAAHASRHGRKEQPLGIEKVETNPAATKALVEAKARFGQRDIVGALGALDRAVELDPTNGPIHYLRGATRSEAGDTAGALADYDRAIALTPAEGAFFSNRGVARQLAGNPAGARADLDHSLELDPKNAVAWFNRGWVRGIAGDADGAEADLRKSIALDPKNPDPWLNLGTMHAQAGKVAEAEKDFTHALELDPEGVDALI
jgi:serine/threonine-protein kinase